MEGGARGGVELIIMLLDISGRKLRKLPTRKR